MKINLTLILTFLFYQFLVAQTIQGNYEKAFEKLNCMLNETCKLSFKEAVFTVENAYFSNNLNLEILENEIRLLKFLSKEVDETRELIYDGQDKEEVQKIASLFTVMTDTISIMLDSIDFFLHKPFQYDFNDIFGQNDWSNMFVSKLIMTKKGNCHSLPYLYKILADELGAKSHIAVAPNHFYIKHQNKVNGWYNTELTSGIFPIDAWLMASGYIHLDAIVNKLYMEALNGKQSIALCMVDLAKGYERKLGLLSDYDFVLKCCDTALKYYPRYINGLLLKAETKKKQFDALMEKFHAEYPTDIFYIPEAKQLYLEVNKFYAEIHQLGYRKMPNKMYLDWLVSLKEEHSKYENKNIINFKTK